MRWIFVHYISSVAVGIGLHSNGNELGKWFDEAERIRVTPGRARMMLVSPYRSEAQVLARFEMHEFYMFPYIHESTVRERNTKLLCRFFEISE